MWEGEAGEEAGSSALWSLVGTQQEANGKRGGEEGAVGGAVGCASSWRLGTAPSREGWALVEKDSMVCSKDLSLMLPALELLLLKVRLGAWPLSRNLHITRMC